MCGSIHCLTVAKLPSPLKDLALQEDPCPPLHFIYPLLSILQPFLKYEVDVDSDEEWEEEEQGESISSSEVLCWSSQH